MVFEIRNDNEKKITPIAHFTKTIYIMTKNGHIFYTQSSFKLSVVQPIVNFQNYAYIVTFEALISNEF